MRVLWFVLMNVHSLHGTPLGLVWTRHADHLHLSVNWPSKGPAGDAQVHVRVDVLEADPRVLAPKVARADHLPVVARVALALLVAVARDLLVPGQGTREVVRVQVLVGRDVVQPDGGPTGHWLAPLAHLVHLALDRPVAVHVVFQLGGRHRLLSTPRAVFDVVRVQAHLVGIVQQLYDRPAGYVLRLGRWKGAKGSIGKGHVIRKEPGTHLGYFELN